METRLLLKECAGCKSKTRYDLFAAYGEWRATGLAPERLSSYETESVQQHGLSSIRFSFVIFFSFIKLPDGGWRSVRTELRGVSNYYRNNANDNKMQNWINNNYMLRTVLVYH